MPKSKRNRVVSLTQTEKKGRSGKEGLVEDIQECIQNYKFVYVFRPDNVRNKELKFLRNKYRTSRFFFGKNKVMQLALGRDAESEKKPNLHFLTKRVAGQCGLFFTNEDPERIQSFFSSYSSPDFPRAGFTATKTVTLSAGMLDKDVFPASIEPRIRQLGMPTILQNGITHLQGNYTVCKQGEVISPEQAKLLKILGEQMSEFKITLIGLYHNSKYTVLVNEDMDIMINFPTTTSSSSSMSSTSSLSTTTTQHNTDDIDDVDEGDDDEDEDMQEDDFDDDL